MRELIAENLGGATRQEAARRTHVLLDQVGLPAALIVCDEPVSALDISVQAQVIDLIADRVLVLHHGQVVERGAVDEVFVRPRHAYTHSLLAAVPPPLQA